MSDKFRLLMDSKARTKEEIAQELQRMIELRSNPEKTPPRSEHEEIARAVRSSVQDKIRSIVREALESAGEDRSYGEKRPPRQPRDNVDYLSGRTELRSDELAYAASETEEEPDSGDVRAKISAMRKLSRIFYNGYMLRQCAEETLVRQGEYVKDVTDDFGRNCFCGIERPIYGALSTEQLRTYFTWRTLARSGIYNQVDKPYIILYCYELLNRIGVLSAADAYNRLSGVWEGCRGFCSSLDKVIPRWLKDFRAFNDLGDNFTVSPAENIDSDVDSDIGDILEGKYSGKFEYMALRSSYNIRGSIFCTDENRPLLEGALEEALKALDGYFSGKSISLFELICGRLWKDHSWSPFEGAYVDLDRMDGFHSLKISRLEQYSVKRGQPCLEEFEQAPYRNLIGWIMKSVESVLRKRTGFRYGISPNINPVLEDMTNREKLYAAVSDPEFAEVVTLAAEKWCDEHGIFPPRKQRKRRGYDTAETEKSAPAVRAPVEIDVSKLAKIRREADETTRKLIVEDIDEIPQEDISDRVTAIEEDAFEEQTAEYALEHSANIAPEETSEQAEGWGGLAQRLSGEEISLLRALTEGTAVEYCRSRGVMPETQYDRINDAAMECIGDILIENGELIEDYLPDIETVLARVKER